MDRRSEDLNFSRGRGGRPYQRARAQVFATETHCHRCGHEVDKTLPYRDLDTGQINRWSKTFGHTTELDAGGDPYDGHLEHWYCNISAGARYRNNKYNPHPTPPTTYYTNPAW